MKKLVLLFAALALIGSVAMAQVQLSDIYGTVVLPDGSAIPGVTVTLTGDVIGKMTGVTSAEGNFRFLKLGPGNYEVKFELEGFKTVVRKGIRVFLGKNVTLTIPMETTTIQEEVIVSGKAAIVDVRKNTVAMNVTKEMIQSLPTARNPWTVMNLVPGLMLDRVDVGGTDSGQQSNMIAGGADRDDSTWNVDGANITDPSAIGSSPAYLNVNSLEEIQVTVGANDITAQTGGIQLNFVTKKSGNRYAGDFHLYVSDKAWELKQDLTPYMERRNFVNPGVNRLYQYGVNYGGPIIKDKWFWNGSWGIQDIHGRTITGVEDATWLVMGYFKTNFQLGNTSGDFHMTYDNKQKWGRTTLSPAQQNNGSLWDQNTPGYLYYGALQQIFGNLMLEAKMVYTDGGFVLDPRGGNINPLTGHNEGAEYNFYRVPRLTLDDLVHYETNRNMINASLTGNYFAENVLGGEGKGVKVLMSGLDYERAVLSGGPLGIMAACMDVVLPYLHERKQFDTPIGEFQLMQGKVADMYSTWQATRAYVYAVGRACDSSDHARTLRKDAAGAILYSAEKATWMAGEAIQTLGGNGYINEYPAGRLWRDAKLYEIGAGTSEIRRMLIGRELFKETA